MSLLHRILRLEARARDLRVQLEQEQQAEKIEAAIGRESLREVDLVDKIERNFEALFPGESSPYHPDPRVPEAREFVRTDSEEQAMADRALLGTGWRLDRPMAMS